MAGLTEERRSTCRAAYSSRVLISHGPRPPNLLGERPEGLRFAVSAGVGGLLIHVQRLEIDQLHARCYSSTACVSPSCLLDPLATV